MSNPPPKRRRIALICSELRTLLIYRGPLVDSLLERGYDIVAIGGGGDDASAAAMAKRGLTCIPVPLARAGLNPLRDIGAVRAIRAALRDTAPDAMLAYHIKAVTYGLLAARLAGTRPRFALITGLGYAFVDTGETRRRILRYAAEIMYRTTLRWADRVFFQNPDDAKLFLDTGLVSDVDRVTRVNGSGVDMDRFRQTPMPPGPLTFVMIARLIRDKGVAQFVEAARIVKRRHPDARFMLVGPFDDNPASIRPADVEGWVSEQLIDYAGETDDVRPFLAAAHVFVLPTYYREGVPLSILEAMATGRAIVTTDTPGCRETVEAGRNGFLVPPRDVDALADALARFADSPALAESMGEQSHALALAKFSGTVVAGQIVDMIDDAIAERHPVETRDDQPASRRSTSS